MRDLVNCSDSKAKIMIGSHTVSSNVDTFRHPDDPQYDGIHMYGPLGTSGYTMSILDILSCVFKITKPHHPLPPKFRSVYPSQASRKTHEASSAQKKQYTSPHVSSRSPPTKSPVSDVPTNHSTPSVFQYAVKTFNRFSHFLS